MRALSILLALCLSISSRAADREALAKFTREHIPDLAIVEGDNGAGSAFLVRIGKGRYLITNQHVVVGMENPMFKRADRTHLKAGTAAAAAEHDIMAFGVDQEGSAFESMQQVDQHACIGDEIAVLGNPSGEGVINSVVGTIVGIGPQRVEVSAEFVKGNSGSPIIHLKTGKVIAVASHMTRERVTTGSGREEMRTRRFGYRLDSVQKWMPVKMWEFQDEGKTVHKVRLRTSDLLTLIAAINANRDLAPSDLDDADVRSIYQQFLLSYSKTTDAASRLDSFRVFMASILQASKSDITHARMRISYDFFLGQLDREASARAPFPQIFERIVQRLSAR